MDFFYGMQELRAIKRPGSKSALEKSTLLTANLTGSLFTPIKQIPQNNI